MISKKTYYRVKQHLMRRTARIALVLGSFAVLGSIAVGPESSIGQVLLVIVGILVSVIVLPDTPHKIWNVKAQDLADTVPRHHLFTASRSIALAIDIETHQGPEPSKLPEEFVKDVWEESLLAVERYIDQPSDIVFDLEYNIRITPSLDDPKFYHIQTTNVSKRCIPNAEDEQIWFSFCSDGRALEAEYRKHSVGCIAREMVEAIPGETYEQWVKRVDGFSVTVMMGGKLYEPLDSVFYSIGTTKDNGSWIGRVTFPVDKLITTYCDIKLISEYYATQESRTFPIKFSTYAVAGLKDLTFEVQGDVNIQYDEYFAAWDKDIDFVRPPSLNSNCVTIQAPEVIFPPGVGAVFTWTEEINLGD